MVELTKPNSRVFVFPADDPVCSALIKNAGLSENLE